MGAFAQFNGEGTHFETTLFHPAHIFQRLFITPPSHLEQTHTVSYRYSIFLSLIADNCKWILDRLWMCGPVALVRIQLLVKLYSCLLVFGCLLKLGGRSRTIYECTVIYLYFNLSSCHADLNNERVWKWWHWKRITSLFLRLFRTIQNVFFRGHL